MVVSLRLFAFLPVSAGRHAGLSLEQLRKMIGVLKRQRDSDLLDGQVGVSQHIAGPADLQLQMVLVRSQARLRLEDMEELCASHVESGNQVFQR